MSTETAPVILIDGSSYLFRAYHALPPLTTSSGQPTGAVRGVISMVRSLIKEYPDSRVIVVFDAKGPTFRNQLYSEYKSNRPPMPDDLRVQIQPIHDLVDAMGLPRLVIEGVEADDVIGTLAHQAETKEQNVIISTGDKDMAQLVNSRVSLLNTMTNTHMDEQGVLTKFGVRPDQIVDYLALVGDKADNIPGVEKCGPKTAVKWLDAYDNLEHLMQNADAIKGKIGEHLRLALDKLPLSKRLARIKTDVELPFALTDLTAHQPDHAALKQLYTRLEFKTWLTELEGIHETASKPASISISSSATPSSATPSTSTPSSAMMAESSDYQVLLTKSAVNQWIKRIKERKCFAVDTETTSLKYKEAELVGISLAIEPGEAAYIPVGHQVECAPKQLDREWVLKQLKPVLENVNIQKIGQHIKYDAHIFEGYGITLQGMHFDTMLESYVLHSTATRHDMDSLAAYYLQHETISFVSIAGKGVKQKTFDEIPLEIAAPYACEDADITLRLHQHFAQALAEIPRLKQLYDEIECPLIPILQKMESIGTSIDPALLAEQSEELAEKMDALEQEAYQLAGETFNLGSPKQLQTLFFEKFGMPIIKKTPKGQPSTAEPVLQELALDYELPAVILEYRSLSKLKSTYTDPLPLMINAQTGRIHTSYHQAVTATGRLSSSDPNLQNIPIRSAQGRKIRQAFVAPPGSLLIAADYSQIELRIMAHLSQDAGLLAAFARNLDVHSATAAEIFGVALAQVSGEQRRQAKAINFGLIYGMSAFGLARQIDVSRSAAQSYIDRYFERYPGVHAYMERIRKEASANGYVETLFGRRLYVPEINARNGAKRQAAERTAINAPMQGTAADIIKKAMIAVDHWLTQAHPQAHLLMQVHDELIVEAPKAEAQAVQKGLIEAMSSAAELDVPLLVEAGIGKSWGDAHGL
jgi:DNA polymerase-1